MQMVEKWLSKSILDKVICLKLKNKKVTLSILKKPKLYHLHTDDGDMGPHLDQLPFKLNRYGSNSLEISSQDLKHQFVYIT